MAASQVLIEKYSLLAGPRYRSLAPSKKFNTT